jgi:murein DD-endopeptidase MepM/ murein hydrolase activator NlpD
MPEQELLLGTAINPEITKGRVTTTTPEAVTQKEGSVAGFFQAIGEAYKNTQKYTLGSTVWDAAQRNPAFGGEAITLTEANKRFGLSLTGNPSERVSTSWAENQRKKIDAQKRFEIGAAGNPNQNMVTGFIGGAFASLTDPAELMLNIGTGGLAKWAQGALLTGKALQAGTRAATIGRTIVSSGLVREGVEAVVSSGISTTATALQAQQQDKAVFGPDGYGLQQAAFDTATSGAASIVLYGLGKGIGAGIGVSKRTLAKVVDPQRAAAEVNAAARTGEALNPANAIDIPKMEQKLAVQNTNIESTKKILDDAEKSLGLPEEGRQEILSSEALRESVALEEGAPVPKNENVRITHLDQPVFKAGSLKQKVTVEGTAFVSPLGKLKVSSQFGQRHGKQHRGTDFAAEMGTPIGASRGGVVRKVGNQPNGAGNYVVIDHGGGWVTKYFHMSKINVTEGQKVKSGFEIGGVGNSGRSTGPHLHFEIWKDGKAVDPEIWLNKKTAIAEAAPASRDVPPVKFDDDAPIHLHPEDEVAMYSKNMPEFSENAKTTTRDLIDKTVDLSILDPAETSPSILNLQYEELAERMQVLSEYVGAPINTQRIMQGFREGGDSARRLLAAAQKAPDAAAAVVTKILDDARSSFKMADVRIGKGQATKLAEGIIDSTDTLEEIQYRVAKELPVILTAHRILEGMGQGRVTEELPLRYFMRMFGDNVSDYGKAILGEIDASNNQPLYRVRREGVGKFSKGLAELSKLLGEAKKNQGVIERLSLADTKASDLTKQADEILKNSPTDYEGAVVLSKQLMDERFKMYKESGLFDEASIRQLEGIRSTAQKGIDKGNFAELDKGGDKALAVETTIRNNKEYTAALEKIKDILTVCASRGLGRG